MSRTLQTLTPRSCNLSRKAPTHSRPPSNGACYSPRCRTVLGTRRPSPWFDGTVLIDQFDAVRRKPRLENDRGGCWRDRRRAVSEVEARLIGFLIGLRPIAKRRV